MGGGGQGRGMLSNGGGCCILTDEVGKGGGKVRMGGEECDQDGIMINCGDASGSGGRNNGGVCHRGPGGIGGGGVRSDGHGWGWKWGHTLEVYQWRFVFNEGSGRCVRVVVRWG